MTETGDAEWFAAYCGDRVRFDERQGRWLVFDAHRWVKNASGALRRMAIESIRYRQERARIIQNEDVRRVQLKWAHGGESRARLDNVLALARDLKPVNDDGAAWDPDPWLLGVANGVLDLHTGQLRDGRPEDRITMSTRGNYDPQATCPEWEQTISNVFNGDAELMMYAQCALGYSITGITREQCFFLNTGGGSNGKGTTINTVAWVLGDYADDLPFSALEIHKNAGIPNDVAKIAGKRFVTASETNDDIQLNEARIKSLTGEDPITARFLHREFFTFHPAAKFWLSCNGKPVVRDTSYGFWRRVRVLPWLVQFSPSTHDKALTERLRGEMDGILRWLVDGCLYGWQQQGLTVPAAVHAATVEYESDNDGLAPFIASRCVVGDGNRIGAMLLYREYTDWAIECNEGRSINIKRFAQMIRRKFHADENREHQVTYLGIGIR